MTTKGAMDKLVMKKGIDVNLHAPDGTVRKLVLYNSEWGVLQEAAREICAGEKVKDAHDIPLFLQGGGCVTRLHKWDFERGLINYEHVWISEEQACKDTGLPPDIPPPPDVEKLLGLFRKRVDESGRRIRIAAACTAPILPNSLLSAPFPGDEPLVYGGGGGGGGGSSL